MKKFLFLALAVLLVFPGALAQTAEIESLIKKAKQESGREKLLTLTQLCKSYYSVNPPEGLRYGEMALRMADSLKMPSAKSSILTNMGVNHWAAKDFAKARKFYRMAMEHAVRYKDSTEIALIHNRMGLLFETLGNFDSALIVFNLDLSLSRKLKNQERVGTALSNIGTIYLNRGELKSALKFLIEAATILEKAGIEARLPMIYLKLGGIFSRQQDYAIAEKWYGKGIDLAIKIKDLGSAATGKNSLGILYKEQQEHGKALKMFAEALNVSETIGNVYLSMSIFTNMGNVYTNMGDYSKALYYQQKALDVALKLKMPIHIAITQNNLGVVYFKQKKYQEAKRLCEKALPVFQQSGSKSNLLEVYQQLINIHDSLHDYAQSVKYYRSFIDLSDSLKLNELNASLDSLKIKFNTEQTEKDNQILLKDKEIQARTISNQRQIIWFSVVFLVLLAIIVIVVVRNRKKIKQANLLLESKNKEITSQAEDLRQLNSKLVELSRFKESMNSFLVHDLKNPLNSIIHADFTRNTELLMGRIKQASRQMLNLVMNMLDLNKNESSMLKLSVENSSLTRMISEAIREVEYISEQKKIRFSLLYTEDRIMRVDPYLIRRVLINLFTNAVRFSNSGSSVDIDAELINGNFLKILIKDYGVGIKESDLPSIFDKYTQGHTRGADVDYSTGIGLTFCKMAVEANGGSIGVDSVEGKGSTFWFTLPIGEPGSTQLTSPSMLSENAVVPVTLSLTEEEMEILRPVCERLKKISIFQVSDVKDVLTTLTFEESMGIGKWKSMLLEALSQCNETTFTELINCHTDART